MSNQHDQLVLCATAAVQSSTQAKKATTTADKTPAPTAGGSRSKRKTTELYEKGRDPYYHRRKKREKHLNALHEKYFQQHGAPTAGLTALPNGSLSVASGFHLPGDAATVVLPFGTRTVTHQCFQSITLKGCVIFPPTVTTIGCMAFKNQDGLTGLYFEQGEHEKNMPFCKLHTIGAQAFMNCAGLLHANLPPQLQSVEEAAFMNCVKLQSVGALPQGLRYFGNSVFHGCEALEDPIQIPVRIKEIPSNAFNGCANITEVQLHPYITVVREGAFEDAQALAALSLPPKWRSILINATKIEARAFRNCVSLHTSLRFENMFSLTHIGDQAFENCRCLTGTLVLPERCTHIGKDAFKHCQSLVGRFQLSSSTVTVGSRAFLGCSGLVGPLQLPDTILHIGAHAFMDCSGLYGRIVLPKYLAGLEHGVFMNCGGLLGTLTVHANIQHIKEYALENTSVHKLDVKGNAVLDDLVASHLSGSAPQRPDTPTSFFVPNKEQPFL